MLIRVTKWEANTEAEELIHSVSLLYSARAQHDHTLPNSFSSSLLVTAAPYSWRLDRV
jgi:hypothetical protein